MRYRIFTALVLATITLPGASFATVGPFNCLNDGVSAIEPIEAAKKVLIEGRVTQLFEEMDKAEMFTTSNATRIENEFGLVYENEGAIFCLPVQRNDFSDSFASEVFMLQTSKAFFYVAIYVFNDGSDWNVVRFDFNTEMSAMDRHIK